MRRLLLAGIICYLSLALTACGGGSGSGDSSATSLPVIPPGTTFTMTANSAVLVPAGTIVVSPNGNTDYLNGTFGTDYTQAGAVVTVPASSTGPANNTVSTKQPGSTNIIASTAKVTVIAGSATIVSECADGTGTDAIFWGGGHLAIDRSGNIFVTDRGGLRKVTPAGVVTTLSPGYSPFDWEGIAIDAAGNIFGSGMTAQLDSQSTVTWGTSLHEMSSSGTIRNITTNWETSTSTGSIGRGGLAVDTGGNLYLADRANNRIVKFTPEGVMSVFAGSGTQGSANGSGVAASFNNPTDVAIDSNGNLFVNDNGNSLIRKIAPDGTVSTIAEFQYLDSPIAVDPAGNIYTVVFPNTILRIDTKQTIRTNKIAVFNDFISALATDSNGNLYAATRGQGAQILKISF